jgi:uncharacterized membrane protein YoaK (UPF0700 family)
MDAQVALHDERNVSQSRVNAPPRTRPAFTMLLSLNGGYVDTAGFLAMQGLFTAHVTGNFVTLAAALIHGASGVTAKLIALPVFCAVVALVRLLGAFPTRFGVAGVRSLLVLKTLLLTAGGVCAIAYGPFPDADVWPAVVTGMLFVAAMAVQNAVQRIHMADAPPSTLMTGNTTQIVIDAVDLVRGAVSGADAARARLRRMSANVGGFAAGCAIAACLFALAGDWCFAAPPLLGLASLLWRLRLPD